MLNIKYFRPIGGELEEVHFNTFFSGFLCFFYGEHCLIETSRHSCPELNFFYNTIFFYHRDDYGKLTYYGEIVIENEGSYYL